MSSRIIREWNQPFKIFSHTITYNQLVKTWNKSFLVFSVLALAVDPLFFFVPILDGAQKFLDVDRKLLIALCIIRSFVDLLSILHIIIQYLTRYKPKYYYYLVGLRFFDPRSRGSDYLRSHLVIDLLASLPVPQAILISIKGSSPFLLTNLLKLLIICQFIPRIIRLKLIYKKVTKQYDFIFEKAWAGAVFNFLLYLLASHVVGSLWYLFAIESKLRCWSIACQMHNCDSKYLYRGEGRVGDFGFLNTSCPLLESNEIKDPKNFHFGIFLDIIRTGMLETRVDPNKIYRCSLWGLQSLSSLGQNLKASMYYEEILFVYFIAAIGLFLLALLLGNVQKYIQSYSSLTHRLEEMKEKRQAAEELMSYVALPDESRVRVRRYNLLKWKLSKSVELDDFVKDLPRDIRRDVMRYLCLKVLKEVPTFKYMEDQLFDTMCECIKPVFYTQNSLIMKEGYPVEEMVFIIQGMLHQKSVCYNYERIGSLEAVGDELLGWALHLVPGEFPIANSTVTTMNDVQGFALEADDLKFLASRFSPSTHKRVEYYFKVYSMSWRVRAASYIQAAWHSHCRWKQQNNRRIWAANCIQAAWRSHCRSRMCRTPN